MGSICRSEQRERRTTERTHAPRTISRGSRFACACGAAGSTPVSSCHRPVRTLRSGKSAWLDVSHASVTCLVLKYLDPLPGVPFTLPIGRHFAVGSLQAALVHDVRPNEVLDK